MSNDDIPNAAPAAPPPSALSPLSDNHSYGSPGASSNVNTGPNSPFASHSRRSSLSRVPVPGPVRVTPRITTASSPTTFEPPNPSPVGGGPASGNYVVPPRPKPGRKPATDEPASKRKAQNRESQRAFRARKAAKLTEMQLQVDTTQQQHRQELMEKEAQLTELRNEIRQIRQELTSTKETVTTLTRERNYYRDKASQSNQALPANDLSGWSGKYSSIFPPTLPQSRQDSPARDSLAALTPLTTTPQAYNTPRTLVGCGSCKSDGECACMDEIAKLDSSPAFMPTSSLDELAHRRASASVPMDGFQVQPLTNDNFADREIDFTAQFSTRRNRLDNRASINFMTQPHEPCGFCTDENNCLCRDQSLQLNSGVEQSVQTPLGSRQPRTDRAASAPGTCDDCMRDPKQKAWCQRVAQLKRSETDYFSSTPRSRKSSMTSMTSMTSMSSPLDPMEPRIAPGPATHMAGSSRSSIGCSDAYKLFDGRVPVDQDNMDWSSLNPHSPAMRRDTLPAIDPSRTYSALELDTAGVIATLQQTIGPLNPRQQDGPHAELVQIADSQRSVGYDGTER